MTLPVYNITRTPEEHACFYGRQAAAIFQLEAARILGSTLCRATEHAFVAKQFTFPRSLLLSEAAPGWIRIDMSIPDSRRGLSSDTKQHSDSQKISVTNGPGSHARHLQPISESVAIGIRVDRLAEGLDASGGAPLNLPGTSVRRITPQRCAKLEQDIAALIHHYCDVQVLELRIVTALAACLEDLVPDHGDGSGALLDAKEKLVDDALAVVLAGEQMPLSMPGLALRCGCSEADLNSAFMSVMSLSVQDFLDATSLNLFRRKLLYGPARSTPSLAWECGYRDMDSVDKSYEVLFGERPESSRNARPQHDLQRMAR